MKQNKLLYYILAAGFLFAGIMWAVGCQKESIKEEVKTPSFAEMDPFQAIGEVAVGDDLVVTLQNGDKITVNGQAYRLELRDSISTMAVDSLCDAFHASKLVFSGGQFPQWKYFYFPRHGLQGWAKLYRQVSFIPELNYNTGEPYFMVWDTVWTGNNHTAYLSN